MKGTPDDATILPEDPHEAKTIAPDKQAAPNIRGQNHPTPDLSIGQQLGPYKILDLLGEGGFGSVYKAEQSTPVKRIVALKIIKLGMDTKRVMARFAAERQALAVMDHPNIAHVLDAGATDSGRPFFVMELVKGIPLNEYCTKHNLTNTERLELFLDVCKAVQHAHQKGIIHRDLKPTNVLVCLQDEAPMPKVIDFGIAKAMHQPLTEQTVVTQMQQLIGTPEYMSPEQAENSGLDIDTRSDIYSLGVMLFELLTDSTPCNSDELRQSAITDLPRMLRETKTPKPSLRITQLDMNIADDVARHHRVNTSQLKRQLKGDLDWIVLKALEKDRTRRYDSATALSDDIHRYLNDEPVLAGPPSTVYRFSKFAKRNKTFLTAACLVAISLVGGLAFSTYAFYQERIQRQIAILAQQDAVNQRDAAIRARDESEAVTTFLENTLTAADPAELGRQVTVRDVLDLASPRIGSAFPDKPHIEARLRRAIGDTYIALGLYDDAQQQIPLAVDILDSSSGPEDPATLLARESLGTLRLKQGLFEEARDILEATIKARKTHDGETSLETLTAMRRLGVIYKSAGQYDEALKILTEADALLTKSFGDDHPETLRTREQLAHTYLVSGQLQQAEPLFVSTLADQQATLGEDHPDSLQTLSNLALLRRNNGQYPQAEKLYKQALEIQQRVLGNEHPDTLSTMTELAWLYVQMSRPDDAQALYEQTLSLQQELLGNDHPLTLETMANLAQLAIDRSQFDKALSLLTTTLPLKQRVLGNEHPSTLSTMGSLALVQRRLGNLEQAREMFQTVIELDTRVLGAGHPSTISARSNLANVLSDLGSLDEARDLMEEVLEYQLEAFGPEHPTTLGIQINLAGLLWQMELYEEAEPIFLSVLDVSSRVLGEEHSYTLTAMGNLALIYKNQKRYHEAERMYLRTLEVQRRTLGEAHANTLKTMQNLVLLFMATNRYEEAVPLTRQVLEQNLQSLGSDHPDTLRSMHTLAELLTRVKEYEEATQLLEASHTGRVSVLGEDNYDTQVSRRILATLYFRTGQQDKAAALFLRWYESRKRTHSSSDPNALAMGTNLMILFHQLGDLDQTRRITLDLLHARQQLAARSDATADSHYNYALLLLECLPESLRDPSLALPEAQQAVELSSNQDASRLALLAQAHFALGNTPDAASTLREAIALLSEGDERAGYETILATYEQPPTDAQPSEGVSN